MTARGASVTTLWRHPIKSHGRETCARADLRAGEAFPFDRFWAITHDATQHDGGDWSSCRNFMIGARTPALAGIWATLDEDTLGVTLRHAALGEITVRPDEPDDAARLIDWLMPLSDGGPVAPRSIVRAGPRGMTDTDYASVSIMSHASHAAVSARLGGALEEERWRGNIWLDGLAPWEELEWIGRDLVIGGARLRVTEPITRCKHTMANPRTGERDADTLGVLTGTFGHQHFGIYARVTDGGSVAPGDPVEVL